MEQFLSSLKTLTNKYLAHFHNNSMNEHRGELLNDMSTTSELLDLNSVAPLETLKEVMARFGYEESFYNHIIDIKDHFSSLSIIELFTLLYFCTCRNPMTFDESFYISSIDNGCIFSLLEEINKRG